MGQPITQFHSALTVLGEFARRTHQLRRVFLNEGKADLLGLLIFESKKYDQLITHLKSLGVRITGEMEEGGQRSAFIHPSSASGALVEIIEKSQTNNPWPAAGPDWQSPEFQKGKRQPKTRQLRQVAVLVKDLDQAVDRWGEMFGLVATSRFDLECAPCDPVVQQLVYMHRWWKRDIWNIDHFVDAPVYLFQ